MTASPTPVASQRRLETRTKLLDAAIDVFAADGVQGASVEAICQRANFTRGAFYSNFSSKEELFLAVLDRELTQRIDAVEHKARELAPMLRERATEITTREATGIITEFFLPTDHATQWLILETEFLLMVLRDPEFAPQYHAFVTAFTDRMERLIEIVLRSAGRETLVPIDLVRSVLSNQYEVALKLTALAGPEAPGGLASLGSHLADLIFALTRPSV